MAGCYLLHMYGQKMGRLVFSWPPKESQDHRMSDAGRQLSIHQAQPLPQQHTQSRVPGLTGQVALGDLQGDCTASGQPVCSITQTWTETVPGCWLCCTMQCNICLLPNFCPLNKSSVDSYSTVLKGRQGNTNNLLHWTLSSCVLHLYLKCSYREQASCEITDARLATHMQL